jgi:hypothetical protein
MGRGEGAGVAAIGSQGGLANGSTLREPDDRLRVTRRYVRWVGGLRLPPSLVLLRPLGFGDKLSYGRRGR